MSSQVDRTKIDRFWEARSRQSGIEAARFHPEFTPFDVKLAESYLADGTNVLDLGCGTCALANALAERQSLHIHAVDKFPGMLTFADKRANLTTEVADAVDYKAIYKFNVILLFGVINSIPDCCDRIRMYKNQLDMLVPGGILIVKSQFGIYEEVAFDGFSDGLGMDYTAVYPFINDEQAVLEKLFSVDRIDPYPAEYNNWKNTHFYALVCRKLTD